MPTKNRPYLVALPMGYTVKLHVSMKSNRNNSPHGGNEVKRASTFSYEIFISSHCHHHLAKERLS